MSEFLRVERRGAVATLWIDRQPKMNTMTVAMRNEFPGLFAGLEADESVRVVVIRGAGGKAFSAGGDVAEFLTLAPADLELWGDTLTSAERCRKPVIAAIDGFTMGAGLEPGGGVRLPHRHAPLRVRLSRDPARHDPGSGGSQRALRLIGMTRAKLFMMTGQRIGAERAEAWGLITQAVANDQLDEAVGALAGELAERAPLALRTLKMVINRGAEAPLETALELERKVVCRGSARPTTTRRASPRSSAPAEVSRAVGHHRAAAGAWTLTRLGRSADHRGLATGAHGREVAVASLADVLKGALHEVLSLGAADALSLGEAHRRSAPPWRGRGSTALRRCSNSGRDQTPGRACHGRHRPPGGRIGPRASRRRTSFTE